MKVIVALVSTAVIAGIIYISLHFYYGYRERFLSDTPVIGEVIEHGPSSKGDYSLYRFEYNSKGYEFKIGRSVIFDIGDKMWIYVDTADPEQSRVDFTHPVFLADERTDTTIAKIIGTIGGLEYEYEVDGIKYTKVQRPPKEYKKLYGKISKKDLFLCDYLVANPARSIIRLESRRE